MKIKIRLLQKYLKKQDMTNNDLARAMGVSVVEIEKMLDGKVVGVNTARKFIRYFSAEQAQALIDWDAIGKRNPLADDYTDTDNSEDENAEDEFDDETVNALLDEDERYSDSIDKDDDL